MAENLEGAVLTWANAATERLLLRGGVPHKHWRAYLGRGKEARTLLKQAFNKRPEGAADVPGRRALRVLRNRFRALQGAVNTPKWRWDFAINTRVRIKFLGAYGMEPEDADRWRDRTLEVDSASGQELEAYIAELDVRLKDMEAQHRKDRLHAFRERVRKAVREGKHRLITGWVGEGSSPPISVVLTANGQQEVQPMRVAAAFAEEWGALWKPPPGEGRWPTL